MRPRLVIAASVSVFVIVLAACSGSSSSGAGSSSTTKDAAAKPAASVKAQPSSGCKATTPVTAGEVRIDTTSAGTPRWYYRHVPTGYSATTPTPVVLDLHGYSEGAAVHKLSSALGPYGDTHGFVTITPQGSGAVASWNTALDSADTKFIGDLLDEVENTVCVDERRVFVTGLSNGAFMTSAVACKYSDRIAAAAPVAGIRDIAGCKFSRPVPVIAFHGTADPYVGYDGGLGQKAADLPTGDGRTLGQAGVVDPKAKGPSIPEITAAWAKRNGCTTKPNDTTVASDVTLIKFPCPKDAEVELYRVTDGGHSWPGSQFSKSIESVVGKTTFSIDANELIWKFFEAHPLAR
jgi:polyhydroxybutyrate depolymerase